MFTVLEKGTTSSKKTFCAYSCYWDHKVGWDCNTEFGAVVFGKELRSRSRGM